MVLLPAAVCSGQNRVLLSPRRQVAGERAIQIRRSTDQRQMRQRLRIVPQVLPAASQLLGYNPTMVGIAQHLFKSSRASSSFRNAQGTR